MAHFNAEDAARAWDAAADAWEHFVESGQDYYRHLLHGPRLLDMCGDVAGLKALDLGCGQGYFSRRLAERGARVVGVDTSEGLIANARRHERERPLGIEYRVLDACETGSAFPPGSFDLAAACMSLHDMPDPPRAVSGARRVLKDGGRLVFSLPHPLTDTPYREWERDGAGNKLSLKIDRYFESAPGVTPWNMERLLYAFSTPKVRMTLEQIVDMVTDAGFTVRRLREPRPTQQQVRENPALEDSARVPYFLALECVATG